MFQKTINFCVKMVQRWLPEPFIFAVLLTFVAAVLAMPLCSQSPTEVLLNWGGGVFNLLAFSMQMALVLVCGATLADAPAIKRGISALASLPKTPTATIASVTLVSALACWINWGFGLIVGVIYAKEVARKLHGVDYRLLIASSYSGFVVWHAGVSGSVPLTMATPGESLTKATNGILVDPVPLSHTIFNPYNIGIVVLIIVALSVVNMLMHPKGNKAVVIDPALLADDISTNPQPANQPATPASRLENSKIIAYAIALAGLLYALLNLLHGGSVDLNTVILIFLFVGIMVYGTPLAYVKAFSKSVQSSAGILLQFPFYAGVMGIITGVGESGISFASVISNACVAISTPTTYPVLTFLCAGLINLFVPSGGGQWAVQAPIMFTAGANLGVDHGLTGMAIAWGDAWTNLIQPFWALPALAIARLSAKDIMGFCLIDLLVSGIIICGGMLLWAM